MEARLAFGWTATAAAAAMLAAACSGDARCPHPASPADSCPDLRYAGHRYVEWREVNSSPVMQELGDATYPPCGSCDDGFGGLGATDVWLVHDVDPSKAVIGLREGSQTYVLYVRAGVDPQSLLSDIKPGLLRRGD